MSYVPATVNLTGDDRILQGATYYREFAVTSASVPVDLTAFSGVRCQFRATVASGTIIVTPTMSFVLPKTLGKIGMLLTSTATTAMTATDGGVYDIEVFDAGSPPTVERVVQGAWGFEAEVTR